MKKYITIGFLTLLLLTSCSVDWNDEKDKKIVDLQNVQLETNKQLEYVHRTFIMESIRAVTFDIETTNLRKIAYAQIDKAYEKCMDSESIVIEMTHYASCILQKTELVNDTCSLGYAAESIFDEKKAQGFQICSDTMNNSKQEIDKVEHINDVTKIDGYTDLLSKQYELSFGNGKKIDLTEKRLESVGMKK